MVQIALKMMGQPYTPNMTLQVDQVDPAKKNSAPLFCRVRSWNVNGDWPSQWIDRVLSRKSIQSVIIWPMPLASLTTTPLCNWLSMRQPLQMMGSGWVLMSSKESMTIMIKVASVSWKKAIEAKELNQVHISAEDMAFDQARVLPSGQWYEWVDDWKNRWSWGQVPISAKTGTAETTVDERQTSH